MTISQQDLRAAVADVLQLSLADVDEHADLVTLGLDSLHAMTLAGVWRRSGMPVKFAELIEKPTLAAWLALLSGRDESVVDNQPVEVDESEPFDLALMQHAYWVGRAEGQRLGGVAAHFYHEFDGTGIDPARLEAAVNALLARHGMLRVRILDDGRQQILATSPWLGLRVHDDPDLDALRQSLSHRAMDISAGEVFDVQLSRLPGGRTRMHVNLDMVAADALSLRVLMRDLAMLYQGQSLPPLTFSYPRYLAQRAVAPSDGQAREHWQERLRQLPAAPQLPAAASAENAVVRRHRWLDPVAMRCWENRSRQAGLTPAMALAAVFAETLTAWSAEPDFVLNLPLFDREPLHPDVPGLVGDFTSSVLLAWEGGTPGTFAERAYRLQERFHTDAAHSAYSGVEVLRDASRAQGEQALAPVVYTSALGLGELFDAQVTATFGQPSWIISQGPQVWLDAQVTEVDGGLLVNWDAREHAFAPGLLDAMFQAYSDLLDRLLASDEAWNTPVAWETPVRPEGPKAELSGTRLHDRFFQNAAANPTATALLWGENGECTYGELATKALGIAAALQHRGVQPGDLVAVSLPKGPAQIEAVLGVLAAGAAYLPVGVDQPAARRDKICRSADLVLTEPLMAAPLDAPVAGTAKDLAYVIYTSGSTGEPKGVELSHAAAMNTIDDLVDRFEISAEDRTLALSALDFDLSVFDIFAPLSVGGAVVLIDETIRRDAQAWAELARRHHVSVLNCVPALLDMLLSAADDLPLRVVLLGGDWVRADLPSRAGCRFAGLGGTTETAIHSTVCEVTEVPLNWTSIPYGTPLSNVVCRVVDALGRDCPDWVPGELWIGGAGVAEGYRGDPARTAEKFLTAGRVRWYRTGDQARYWPDGTIEFLGRKDFQVKIRGTRIELGEIEASLRACPGVGKAVAVVADGRLAAAVTPPTSSVRLTTTNVVTDPQDGQQPLIAAYLTHLLGLAPSVISRFERVAKLWRTWLAGQRPQPWHEARQQAAGTWLADIADALDQRANDVMDMIQGRTEPLSLLDDPVLSPDALLHALPDSTAAIAALAQAVTDQAKVLGRPVRLVELGARSGKTVERLLAELPPNVCEYTLFSGDVVDDEQRHSFDVVFSFCSLHTYPDPVTGTVLAALLLAPGATLWVVELPALLPLALVSAALLEEGFRHGNPMLTAAQWSELFRAAGLDDVGTRPSGALTEVRARRPTTAVDLNTEAVRAFLADRLPAAMVPDRIAVLPKLPLTANGKIDRPALSRLLAGRQTTPVTPPSGEIERRVAAVWAEVLGLAEVGREQDFFALGGDSLQATRTVGRLRAAGLDQVALASLFASPTLAGFAKTLTLAESAIGRALIPDLENRHEPFPATDVQRAYWIGRGSGLALGGVGTHFYTEYDGEDVDLARLEQAWRLLIDRHEMLRAVFDEDGRQRILPSVPDFQIPVLDGDVDDLRAVMSHQVLDPERWPLFDVRAVRYGNRTRVGISLDNIILDGLSMMVVYAELDTLYQDLNAVLPPIELSFRDYVQQVRPEPAELERAQAYWRERVPQLPPTPQLPLRVDPSTVDTPEFVRREDFLAPGRWERLKDRAKAHGLTPSTVLLACYAEVLSTWSGGNAVTVNLTLFDRQEVHPHINRVLGDFTSLLLTAYEPGETWLASARALQEQTWRDLDHRDVSAMWVMRELAKAQGAAQVGMPVVFTGALGVDGSFDVSGAFGERVWGISQTPQVWLDLQVHETRGGLNFALDAVEDLFAETVLDGMFAAFSRLLDWLSRADWDTATPSLEHPVRDKVNATGEPRGGLLHERFFATAHRDRTALIWSGGTSTYGELADRALRVAGRLKVEGIQPGDLVAVSMPKGPDQIAAVLGVLAAGAVYVPIGVDQPEARRERICADAGVRLVLRDLEDLRDPIEPVEVPDSSLAYVIYTSGSTGQPKGVEMTHAAAMNTIDDINTRYGVGPDDRVLAVSALDFDLSVYDIFGLLSIGGALVLIGEDERRDPVAWLDYARQHGVTVWNTVPTLLDMLLVTGQHRTWADTLRLALVSGDWVGLDLPGRLRQMGNCRLVAMGGATEAAIWSNALEVDEVPAHWVSIPYGFPLRAQRYRVVDAQGRDCPDWVPGELWIGGAGVAEGYRADPVRTAEKFVLHQGTRWYRTGDRGRYWPDGTLEFLGRVDHQVKVRGHRIELGEIEAALGSYPGVKEGYAVAVGEQSRRRLAGFVVSAGQIDLDALTEHLSAHLPSYAVPGSIVVLDSVPLTANGKVDRKALSALSAPEKAAEAPEGETELLLTEIWRTILEQAEIARHGNFFALGGDSLSATRLVERLRRDHGIELTLRQVFAAPTVAELAVVVDDLNAMEEGLL